jgi:sortase A
MVADRRAPERDQTPTPSGGQPRASSTPRLLDQSDVRRVLRSGLFVVAAVVAAFVFFLFVLSGLVHARAQAELSQRFERELVNAQAPVGQPVSPGAPIAFLDIPVIGLRQVVVEGTTGGRLMAGPGHLRTSAFPGQQGTSVLLGRRSTYGGPFSRIGELRRGDEIRVTTGQGTVTYLVRSAERAAISDARVFASDTSALILITSDSALLPDHRLAVRAEPRGALQPSGAAGAQDRIGLDELGLAGSASGALGLLLWLEIAVVIAFAAVWLVQRWSLWPAWVVTAPPLAAALWLVFEHVAHFLPATL